MYSSSLRVVPLKSRAFSPGIIMPGPWPDHPDPARAASPDPGPVHQPSQSRLRPRQLQCQPAQLRDSSYLHPDPAVFPDHFKRSLILPIPPLKAVTPRSRRTPGTSPRVPLLPMPTIRPSSSKMICSHAGSCHPLGHDEHRARRRLLMQGPAQRRVGP
jgi:hypothetical protein